MARRKKIYRTKNRFNDPARDLKAEAGSLGLPAWVGEFAAGMRDGRYNIGIAGSANLKKESYELEHFLEEFENTNTPSPDEVEKLINEFWGDETPF